MDPPMAMVEYIIDITAAEKEMMLSALKLGHCSHETQRQPFKRRLARDEAAGGDKQLADWIRS